MQVTISLFPGIDPTHPKLLPLVVAANAWTTEDPDIDDEMRARYGLELVVSGSPHALNVHAYALASSVEKALAAALSIWNAARSGNTAMLERRAPEAETQRDFMTGTQQHKGYCRFTVLDHVGEIAKPEATGRYLGLGAR